MSVSDQYSFGANGPDVPVGVGKAKNANAGTNSQEFSAPHGFGPMAKVKTAMGPVYAQALRKGDRLQTKSGAYLPIVAIKRVVLDRDFLQRHPDALPILIRAGAIDRNVPEHDVQLAPNQEFCQTQFTMGTGCKTASDALRKPGVVRKAENMITYTTFHCGRPATVSCEGVWLETAP